MSTANPLPLAGFRVLDLATMLAGPFCAGILGEFGAEVIKVEMPGSGDPLRKFGTMTDSGSTFSWLNESRNKKSVTLDLRKPSGAAVLKDLVSKSDILVENFRPGTLEKWGLDYETLKTFRSNLVMVRISAYGQDGPYRDRPGFARVAHAFAGLSYLAGEPDGPPVVPGSTSLGDYVAGMYGAVGALIAIIGRDRYGFGQMIDVALYEGIFRMLDEIAPVYAHTGYVRERMGADAVNAVPHSHYQTQDHRWVAIACSTDRMFERLARVMGRADLAAPEAYGTAARRVADRGEVNRIVAEWVGSLPCDEVLSRCFTGEVPIGPLNSIADIFADEQFQVRRNLVSILHPGIGEVVVPNVLPRLSETPGELRALGPTLGQHNDEIYRDLLGMSSERLTALKQDGII